MSAAGWALAGLIVLSLLLIAAGVVRIAVAALSFKRRISDLSGSPVFMQVENLETQTARFSSIEVQANKIRSSIENSAQSLRESARIVSLPEAKRAIESLAEEVRELIEALR